ncbi:MAG: acyl-CoA dehydrogenase family protein [Myxococcota bacterium]|jgi:alkylation response protein AidB-like acyl-CoA dehydrogenase|nr:acyl-CoA dehydrogenase family protein [Myxococcota bacterium]
MDLALTEEQQMIVDMTHGILEEHCTIDVVRQMEDDPKGYPEGLWKQFAESGLTGMLIPEANGGSGQSLTEAALVYEKFGEFLAPVPHFVSSVLSARLLLTVGNDAQQAEWLPKIASGDAVLTPAWLEPNRGYGEVGVQMEAKAEGDDFLLSGVKRHVYFASAAERLIVLARGPQGIDLFLVDPSADGVTLTQQLSQSGDAQYRVDMQDVRVGAEARLGAPGMGWQAFNAVLHEGIILLAAQAIGGAQKVLDITVEYSKERVQFDKPLGAFQALAHYMADSATHIDGGRVLVYEAAWNASQDRSISRFAPMAKLFACETYREVTRICAQIWGGVAFTIEYDCQLYFRRAKQLQLSWWDTPYLEELVAEDVLRDD